MKFVAQKTFGRDIFSRKKIREKKIIFFRNFSIFWRFFFLFDMKFCLNETPAARRAAALKSPFSAAADARARTPRRRRRRGRRTRLRSTS